MNVLIVNNLYAPNINGGAEKVAQVLAEGLAKRGYGVAVATLTNPLRGHERTIVNGVRVHYLPIKNAYFSSPKERRKPFPLRAIWHAVDAYNLLTPHSLDRVLREEKPDLVNTHNIAGFSASVWRAVKRRGLPLVHTPHDYYLMCPRSRMYREERNCDRPCADCVVYSRPRAKLSRLVDVATPVSQFVLERHEQFGCFPRAEQIVIRDRNADGRSPIAPSRVPELAGVLKFGYLGSLHPAKGVELLVRSFLDLPKGCAELLIAGRGDIPYERTLRNLADGHPDIHWLGFVQPSQLLRQIDVLVVPSLWHDPSPLVVTEGMSYGLPIIGARRGGIAELMGQGTGWTLDPDEPGALTVLMQRAISSPESLGAMRERARSRAAELSTGAMVDEYLGAYSRAIENNPRTR